MHGFNLVVASGCLDLLNDFRQVASGGLSVAALVFQLNILAVRLSLSAALTLHVVCSSLPVAW